MTLSSSLPSFDQFLFARSLPLLPQQTPLFFFFLFFFKAAAAAGALTNKQTATVYNHLPISSNTEEKS